MTTPPRTPTAQALIALGPIKEADYLAVMGGDRQQARDALAHLAASGGATYLNNNGTRVWTLRTQCATPEARHATALTLPPARAPHWTASTATTTP